MKKINYVNIFFITALFGFSLWFQSHVFFNWDASWHLIGAKRILAGGSYTKDFFDDNLPMVFWFFIPVILLHQYFHLSVIPLSVFFVHCCLLASFLLCQKNCRALFSQVAAWQFHLFQYTLLISLLFLPSFEFAQRDTLVALFLMPYVILMATRLLNVTATRFNLNLLIGVFAAIGISMNPHYILLIGALEIQLWIAQSKLVLARPELMTMSVLILLYLIIIGVFYPDYYTTVIPAYFAFCSIYKDSMISLIFYMKYTPLLAFWLILSLAGHRLIRSDRFLLLLWLSVITAFLVFLIEGKMWLSHFILFIIFYNLFLIVFLIRLIDRTKIQSSTCYIKGFGMAFLISLLIFSLKDTYKNYALAYQPAHQSKSVYNQLYVFLKSQKSHATVYTLTPTDILLPLIISAKMTYLPAWPNMWILPDAAITDASTTRPTWETRWIHQFEPMFEMRIIHALQTQRPDFIITQDSQLTEEIGKSQIQFDYLNYLRRNSVFYTIWQHYHLVKIVGDFKIFQRGAW